MLFVFLCFFALCSALPEHDEFDVEDEVQQPKAFQPVAKNNLDYDEDEFESPKPAAKSKGPAPVKPTVAAPQAPVEPVTDVSSFLTVYWMESMYIIFLLAYAVNFFVGQSRNEAIVKDWGVTYQKLFLDNFSKVGGEAFITKHTQSVYKTTASGRVNCVGLEATLDLARRNCLVAQLKGLVLSPEQDKIILDVAMESTMSSIVFAIINRRNLQDVNMNEETKDLITMAKKRKVEHSKVFPDDLIVYAESAELVSQLLPEAFIQVLQQNAGWVESIHFTDQSLYSSIFNKTLRFVFRLPNSGEMIKIEPLLDLAFAYIDLVASTKLAPIVERKAAKVRQELAAKSKKKESKEGLNEEREKRAEDKRIKEKEAFDKLSPAVQQKELAKRKKREEKRRMKSGKVKVMF